MREFAGGRHSDGLRLEHVVHLEAEALHSAAHAGDGLGIGKVHEPEHAVELAAYFQQPHHGQGLPPGILDPRLVSPLGQQQSHGVTYLDPQLVGYGLAEDHPVLARLQFTKPQPRHVVACIRQVRLELGQHGAHLHPLDGGAVLQQAIEADDRGRSLDPGLGQQVVPKPRPVRQGRLHADELPVGHHREHPVFKFPLEAVHGGEAKNEGHHPEGYANQGRGGNKGDEAVATAGAAVTQAQKEGQRLEHQATSAMMPLTRVTRRCSLAARLKSWVTTTKAVPSSRLSSQSSSYTAVALA